MGIEHGTLGVLHVAHMLRGFEAGGIGAYVRALVAAQGAAGVRASALAAPDLAGPGRGFRASWHRPEVARALTDRIRRDRLDVVHVHHFSGVGFDAVPAARAAGARVVVTVHDHWIDCARGQRINRMGDRCPGPSPTRCAPCVRPDGLPGPLGLWHLGARLKAAAELRPDLWLSVAPHIGPPGAKRCDLPVVQPTLPTEPHPGPIRFLFVGSLLPTKGVDRALAAFRRLPSGAATLDIVGPAVPWELRFADMVRASVVPGVTLHPPGPTAPWYARSDVLLFPSRWDEGCPLVLREAAAAGLHILASDVAGARAALGAYPVTWVADDDWYGPLAECIAGVQRHEPAVFPTMAEHLDWLAGQYQGVLGG